MLVSHQLSPCTESMDCGLSLTLFEISTAFDMTVTSLLEIFSSFGLSIPFHLSVFIFFLTRRALHFRFLSEASLPLPLPDSHLTPSVSSFTLSPVSLITSFINTSSTNPISTSAQSSVDPRITRRVHMVILIHLKLTNFQAALIIYSHFTPFCFFFCFVCPE